MTAKRARASLALAASVAVILGCGYAAISNWSEYRRFPRQAVTIRLTAAGQSVGQWVSISDAEPHCDDARVAQGPVGRRTLSTYVPLSDSLQRHWLMAWYRPGLRCASLVGRPVQGVLLPLDERTEKRLATMNFRLPGLSASMLSLGLCSYCGPERSRLAGALAALAALIAMAWAARCLARLRT